MGGGSCQYKAFSTSIAPEFRSGTHTKSWAWQGVFVIPSLGVESKQETLWGMLGTNLEKQQ